MNAKRLIGFGTALALSAGVCGTVATAVSASDGDRQAVPSDCPIVYSVPNHQPVPSGLQFTINVDSVSEQSEGQLYVVFHPNGTDTYIYQTVVVQPGQNIITLPNIQPPTPSDGVGQPHMDVQVYTSDPTGELNGKCNRTFDNWGIWPTSTSPAPTITSTLTTTVTVTPEGTMTVTVTSTSPAPSATPGVSTTLPAPTVQPTIMGTGVAYTATPSGIPTTVGTPPAYNPTSTATPPPTAMVIPSPTPGKDSDQIAARKVTGWISKETGKLVNWEETSGQPLYVCQGKGGEASIPAMEGLTSDHGRWQFPHQGNLWFCEKQNPDPRMQGYTQHPVVLPYGAYNCDRGELLNAYVGADWNFLKQYEVKWPNPQLARSFTRDMTMKQACFINILVPNSNVPVITPTSSLGKDEKAVMPVTGAGH